jgi:hypothetical protein
MCFVVKGIIDILPEFFYKITDMFPVSMLLCSRTLKYVFWFLLDRTKVLSLHARFDSILQEITPFLFTRFVVGIWA